jgi:hypothetical protein
MRDLSKNVNVAPGARTRDGPAARGSLHHMLALDLAGKTDPAAVT